MGWFFGKRKEVTLVLGGGSARGMAHIGVLKVFEREKIPINRIVGTSMGAFIGAAYAVGISVKKMEEVAYNFSLKKLLDPTIPKMGLLAGGKLQATINDVIGNKTFKDCRIPLAIVTTDIEKNEEVVFQTGDLKTVIRASCSWPGIFNPVRMDGRLLVDGGVKSSVPTSIAKALAPNYIIAVDVGFCVKQGKIENALQMILQSFQIMGDELSRYQVEEADIAITVNLGDFDQAAFHRGREAVLKGTEAAEEKVDEIKRHLGL